MSFANIIANKMLILIEITLYLLITTVNALIGNYSELNPNNSGFSRLSNELDDKCFQWHKRFGTDEVVNGRNATSGEAPWIVYIHKTISQK